MYACLHISQERQMRFVRLEVRKDNVAAKKLYSSAGFVKEADASLTTEYMNMILESK